MNKSVLLQNAKPILFNSAMVKAILDGKKSVTRRLAHVPTDVQCAHRKDHRFVRDDSIENSSSEQTYTGFVCKHCGYGVSFPHTKYPVGSSFLRPKYNNGDVLYVRETFGFDNHNWLYKADFSDEDLKKIAGITRWLPSIHMPKKAARIFLRITDVRLERLQDIKQDPPGPNNQIVREGCAYGCDFVALWENTIPKCERHIYGWDANPWVWVYEFEKIDV